MYVMGLFLSLLLTIHTLHTFHLFFILFHPEEEKEDEDDEIRRYGLMMMDGLPLVLVPCGM